MSALWISLKVALLALAGMLAVGLPLGWLLARRRFPGRAALETLLSLPLVLPPVVVGFALLWLLSPEGPLSSSLLFSWPAASLAGGIVAFPLLLRSVRAAIESVDPGLEEAARNLGASPWRVARTITLPLARRGIVAGALLAFGRALGEFGATVMVAGNIPGRTQTIPLAIFSLAQRDELDALWPLVGAITAIAFALMLVAERLQGGGRP